MWGCREEELWLLSLSKTQDILERQGEERDKSWLLNFVHFYGNSRAAVRPRLCHVVIFWAVLVEGQDLSNSHCWLREEVTQQVLSPAAWQSHFGVLHHAYPCSTVGHFSHHDSLLSPSPCTSPCPPLSTVCVMQHASSLISCCLAI